MNSIINWDLVTLDESSTSKRYGIFGMYAISKTHARHEILFPYIEKCRLFHVPDGRQELTVNFQITPNAERTISNVEHNFDIRFSGVMVTDISNLLVGNNYIFNGVLKAGDWDRLDHGYGFIGYPQMQFDLIDPAIAAAIVKNALV